MLSFFVARFVVDLLVVALVLDVDFAVAAGKKMNLSLGALSRCLYVGLHPDDFGFVDRCAAAFKFTNNFHLQLHSFLGFRIPILILT